MTRLATLLKGRESSDSLPAEARELLERRTCSLVEACHFLGLPTKTDSRGDREQAGTSASRRAKAYVERLDADLYEDRAVAGLAHPVRVERVLSADARALIRRPRYQHGQYVEIPCSRSPQGRYEVETRLLIPMVYPEAGWPA